MIPELSDCRPGIRPTRYNVLIAIERTDEKTAGGLFLPEKHKEREDGGAQRGRIIAASPMAFQGGDWDMEASKPSPGDVVIFQRYAGGEFDGEDGLKYRLVPDEEIKAVAA